MMLFTGYHPSRILYVEVKGAHCECPSLHHFLSSLGEVGFHEPHEGRDIAGPLPQHRGEKWPQHLHVAGRQGLGSQLNELAEYLEDVGVEFLYSLSVGARAAMLKRL